MKFSHLLLLIFLSLAVIFGGGGLISTIAFADITQLSNNADTKNLQFDKVYLYLGNGISGTLTEASFVINDVNTPYTNYISLTLAAYSTEAEALNIGVSSPVDTLSLTAYYAGTGVQTATKTGLSKIFDPDLFYVIYEGGNYNSAGILYWRGSSSDVGLGRCVDSPLGGSGGCGSVVDLTYNLIGITDLPPANCSDGIQNQDETGIDTGGICQDISNEGGTNTLSIGFLCSGAQSGNFKGYQYLGQGLSGSLSQVDIKLLTPGPVYYGKRVSMHIYQSDVYLDNFSDILASNLVWQKGSTFGNSFNINDFNGVVAFTSPDFGSDYNFIPAKHYYLVPRFSTSDAGSLCQFSYLYGSSDSNSFPSGEFYSDAYVKDIYFHLYGISKFIVPPLPVGCATDCFSNVLFLPGLMGSRLYQQDGSADEELWISSTDSKQANLALDINGKSINSIYTKNDTQKLDGDGDETGIVDDVYSANIYQSFITDLKKWKDEDKIIADYAFIPYDWRLSLDDIITDGATTNNNLSYDTPQNFSESFILKKLEALQSNSKSGKVTIIAHSNGGLVAKALVQELKDTNNPLYDKIDKIIFVAVPQVGTPDAVVALLHGTKLGFAGSVMGNDRLRQLSENMPTVYNLLPSDSYFTTVDPAFAVDKLVSFENQSFFNPQTSQYGVFISNETELKNYVLGTDGRTKPTFSDTVHPNIGNSSLYVQAESVHQILDSWSPSPNTKVIQVAGWGEETIAGLDYRTYKEATETLSYKPRFVIDGDGTVVVPSALWMSDSNPNVERWWVDLDKYNGFFTLNLSRKHRDILEIPSLRNFVNSEITDSAFTDSDNIVVDNISTLISDGSRLHYTLHSPLTLGIMDAQGRYTGQDPVTKEIREEIPNVNYKQIGDVQFLSVPSDTAYTVKMQGYQTGNFSLDVDKQEGNNITASTSFQGIPSSTSTLATMDITTNMEVAGSTLKIDNDGDGTVDKTLNATPDGITVYDTIPPEIAISFSTTNKEVTFTGIDISETAIANSSTNITVVDAQNNTSILNLIKFKEKPTKLKFSFNNIVRNGIPTNLPHTFIEYSWKEPHGILTDLDTRVIIKGVERYVFNYNKSKRVTIIKEKVGKHMQTKIQHGFVIVTVKTEGESVKVNY